MSDGIQEPAEPSLEEELAYYKRQLAESQQREAALQYAIAAKDAALDLHISDGEAYAYTISQLSEIDEQTRKARALTPSDATGGQAQRIAELEAKISDALAEFTETQPTNFRRACRMAECLGAGPQQGVDEDELRWLELEAVNAKMREALAALVDVVKSHCRSDTCDSDGCLCACLREAIEAAKSSLSLAPSEALKAVREALEFTVREVECYCGNWEDPAAGFCPHCRSKAALATLGGAEK